MTETEYPLSMWDALKQGQADKVEGAHRRFAQIVKDLAELDRAEAKIFERMEACRQDMDDNGSVAQAKLSGRREAAYREWIREGHEGQPIPRIFTEVPDAPIGPEHE